MHAYGLFITLLQDQMWQEKKIGPTWAHFRKSWKSEAKILPTQ